MRVEIAGPRNVDEKLNGAVRHITYECHHLVSCGQKYTCAAGCVTWRIRELDTRDEREAEAPKFDLVANWFEGGNNTLILGVLHEMAPVQLMAPIGCIREERPAVDGCPTNVVVMQMAKHNVCDVSWGDAEASQLTWQ
jgi:hypothetical protein